MTTATSQLPRPGDKAALAAALARLEAAPDGEDSLALLDAAYGCSWAHVIGLTGPPGVGKSTLTGVLIGEFRKAGRTVGVIAVDPSSRQSGGALLGDRMRLAADASDSGVFVRSMAARDRLGGLAGMTVAAMVLMRAIFDVVLIETVGVGQSETDVVGVADTVVFCVQPGSGDGLQFMKAGIVEIPNIVAITKSDMGAVARRAQADMQGALDLNRGDGWTAPVLLVSAQTHDGIEGLIAALDDHAGYLAGDDHLAAARHAQAENWLVEHLRERFGRAGLEKARPVILAPGASPFRRLAEIAATLSA